jgi:hypothetical protein
MFCTSCGASVARAAKFCRSCGAKLPTRAPNEALAAQPPTRRVPVLVAITVIGVVVFLLSTFSAHVNTMNSQKAPKTAGPEKAAADAEAKFKAMSVEEHLARAKSIQAKQMDAWSTAEANRHLKAVLEKEPQNKYAKQLQSSIKQRFQREESSVRKCKRL